MKTPRSLHILPLLTTSRVAIGKRFRARGIPAVLLGAAAIVLASGVSSALQKAMTVLPESLREARAFWLALRDDRRERLS